MKQMKRKKTGAFVSVKLTDNLYAFARIVKSGNFAFYNYFSQFPNVNPSILEGYNFLFFVSVYNSAINSGRWIQYEHIPLDDRFNVEPLKFIQNPLNHKKFELYEPITGAIWPATHEECIGLECCAVWEPEHVEERLMAVVENRPSKWVESLKIMD